MPAWRCRSATPRQAIELARAAAQHAEHSYAYDEAIAHYRRGLDAARLLDPPDAAVTLDLTVRIAAALHHRGDRDGLPMLLDAARRARDVGDKEALVRAATAIPQFGAVGFVDPMPEGRAITEAALAALGPEPSPARARLLMDLASHWLFLSVDEALRLAARPKRSRETSVTRRSSARCCTARATCSAIPAASTIGCGSAPSSSRSGGSSGGWR